jgi:hypothetical protein
MYGRFFKVHIERGRISAQPRGSYAQGVNGHQHLFLICREVFAPVSLTQRPQQAPQSQLYGSRRV